ncbi:hypothetical protein M3P36_04170 [Altererythrobacter sp. KTW20L]|uniref:hypothetical protein n=1 Tax=Altererythrobacter sp. KTW20L TaxID=2942210 RepID=UPI0020C070C9|nr:hypothetical protein [Altererythrobacter sp. KTW20L]MCL6250245.1 hypothetical protein [Altererythrobacter sp. KTW20L]
MLALLTGLVLAQLNPQSSETIRLEGRCTYPPEVSAEVEGATLVQCGEALLREDGIAFASRGFEPSIRFVGSWNGSELDLHHVARRGRNRADEARGWCRLQYRGEDVSAIVCTAVAGPRSYLANFIVPNI